MRPSCLFAFGVLGLVSGLGCSSSTTVNSDQDSSGASGGGATGASAGVSGTGTAGSGGAAGSTGAAAGAGGSAGTGGLGRTGGQAGQAGQTAGDGATGGTTGGTGGTTGGAGGTAGVAGGGAGVAGSNPGECASDADCDDGDVCTGRETCDLTANTCTSGEAVTCSDGVACTADLCDATLGDPSTGCYFPMIDRDADGYAPGSCMLAGVNRGGDCDDTDDTRHPNVSVECDDPEDLNCNDITQENAPLWYADCDADGFAADTAQVVTQCSQPASAPSSCNGVTTATWTQRAPADEVTTDCYDASALAYPGADDWKATGLAVRPAGSRFDYNCDGIEERFYTAGSFNVSTTAACTRTGSYACSGASGWQASSVPACGASGTYSTCTPIDGGSSCMRSVETRDQSCR